MTPQAPRAFTLIEMIVVIAILLAIAGIGFPLMKSTQEASRRDAARALIAAISGAIADHGVTTEVRIAGVSAALPLWDINLDGLLDGNLVDAGEPGDAVSAAAFNILVGSPGAYTEAQVRSTLVSIGYNGFTATTGFAVRSTMLSPSGRLLDPWKRPFRYAYAPIRRTGSTHTVDTAVITHISDAAIRATALAAAATFGPGGFAVWSAGADGLDGTADDITSFPRP